MTLFRPRWFSTDRWTGRLVVVIGLVLTGADRPHPQAQSAPSNQRIWTGTWEEHDSWEGSSGFGRSQSQISFVYVEGRDEFGLPRWDSRRLTWSAVWEDHRFDRVWVEQYGEADERGIYSNRSRVDIVTVCNGGGTLELGPAVAAGEDLLTPEQKAQLRPSCVTTYRQREAGPTPAPTHSKRDALDAPSVPNEDQLTGCAYEKMWLMGTRGGGSLSVSVSAPVTAVMEVSRRAEDEYARFVPAPGETLSFTASVPAGTARFRFELDPDATSRFPGYATNANVDDAFLAKHQLDQLPSAYANDDPDVIFHPQHHKAADWSRVSALVVETARPQTAAAVTVTTLDYGAVGRLRAFVKSEECGGWQPVPIKFYPDTREFVAIPMDEDNNLMADALEDYHGRQSGADDDAEPKGKTGTAGDGLTVFEEYRGLLTSSGECATAERVARQIAGGAAGGPAERPVVDSHVRTKPGVKDLFVHTPNPDLEMLLPHFAWASGLNVHPICEAHYSGNPEIEWGPHGATRTGDLGTHSTDRTRVVNFTLQFARVRQWRNHMISQDVPQHGLYLLGRQPPPGLAGVVCGDDLPHCNGRNLGPPMFASVVLVDNAIGGSTTLLKLLATTTHELGHSVGLPHHGWKVENWTFVLVRWNKQWVSEQPSVVPPGPDCVDSRQQPSLEFQGVYFKSAFLGCFTTTVIARNAENSGEAECPMRYSFGPDSFREAPGSTADSYAVTKADGISNPNGNGELGPWYRLGSPHDIRLWHGQFLKYDNSLDHEALGRFCLVNKGTGLNGLPGDQAGDSQVACMDQLVVNDNLLRGIR